MASAVLNHRLVLSYEAGLERITAGTLVSELLESTPEVLRA